MSLCLEKDSNCLAVYKDPVIAPGNKVGSILHSEGASGNLGDLMDTNKITVSSCTILQNSVATNRGKLGSQFKINVWREKSTDVEQAPSEVH